MTHEAGIPLGIKFKLLSDTPQDSAAQVVGDVVIGDYRDLDTLREFARGCDVITFDHEHVPTEHLRALEADGIPVRPGPDALVHAQDKGVMRAKLDEIGVPCPRHRIVTDVEDVAAFAAEGLAEGAEGDGFPIILKTVRGGYDGKGVWFVRSIEEAAEPFRAACPSSPRRRSTSYGNSRRTSSAPRTARRSPTPWSSPSRSTASATR